MGSQGESSWDPAVDLLVGIVNGSKLIFAVAEALGFLYKRGHVEILYIHFNQPEFGLVECRKNSCVHGSDGTFGFQ